MPLHRCDHVDEVVTKRLVGVGIPYADYCFSNLEYVWVLDLLDVRLKSFFHRKTRINLHITNIDEFRQPWIWLLSFSQSLPPS